MTLGVAIIGCGLIGQKRAKALGSARLMACADIQIERSNSLGRAFNAQLVTQNWEEAISHPEVDVVIVATTNNLLAEITQASVEAGKHVLVEKPAARYAAELEPVIEAAQKKNRLVHVGFNHRYHPALQKAREIIDAGGAGELMFVRGRYGHGGRLGYEKEWRANPELSGGGELIDQGVHLIDLSRWFLGDFSSVMGFAHTYFWQMPVDDNGFMTLQTAEKKAAHLHVSCTEWKNLFSFEIYGHDAKLHIDGIGGSYGVERLAYYKMLPQMGPPETTIWEYPGEDSSWRLEFAEFAEDIDLNQQPAANLNDAYEALKIVDRIYKDSGHDYRS